MAEAKAFLSLDTSRFETGINRALGGISRLSSKALAIGALAGSLVGVTSAAGLMAKTITEAASFESLDIAFQTLIGSATKAREVLDELVRFAAQTPLEMSDIGPAAKQLIAYGFSASEVTGQLRMLAEVSTGLSVPLGDLAYVYGTLRTQGRAFARDIMQFTQRGVPVISNLAAVMGVAESKVQDLVAAGKIGFPDVQKAFERMTGKGGQFTGMLERQSKTWNGLLATLRDNVNIAFREFGLPILDALKPALQEAVKFVDGFAKTARAAGETIAGIFKSGKLGEVAGLSLQVGFSRAINWLAGGMKAWADTLPEMLSLVFSEDFGGMVVTGFVGVAAKISEVLLRAFETPLKYLQAGIQHTFEQTLDFFQPQWKKDKANEYDAEISRLRMQAAELRREADRKEQSGRSTQSAIYVDRANAINLEQLAAKLEEQRIGLGLLGRSFDQILSETQAPQLFGGEADVFKLWGDAFLSEAGDRGRAVLDRFGAVWENARQRGVAPLDIIDDREARAELAKILRDAQVAGKLAAPRDVERVLPGTPTAEGFASKVIGTTLTQVGGGGRYYDGRDPVLAEERRRTQIVEREEKKRTEALSKALQGGIVEVVPVFG